MGLRQILPEQIKTIWNTPVSSELVSADEMPKVWSQRSGSAQQALANGISLVADFETIAQRLVFHLDTQSNSLYITQLFPICQWFSAASVCRVPGLGKTGKSKTNHKFPSGVEDESGPFSAIHPAC